MPWLEHTAKMPPMLLTHGANELATMPCEVKFAISMASWVFTKRCVGATTEYLQMITGYKVMMQQEGGRKRRINVLAAKRASFGIGLHPVDKINQRSSVVKERHRM